MLIHIKMYSSALVRSAVKRVACEKCGTAFAYEMIRRGTGSGTSVYGLDNKGAADRAALNAADVIGRTLVGGDDLVACTGCGWFQESMITRNASRYWYWTPWGVGNHIEPNRSFPGHRGHFPGTPTAVALKPANQSLFRQRPPDVEPGNILSLRMFQGEFPSCCCNCFGQAESECILVPKGGVNPAITVPACKACVRLFNKRRQHHRARWFALLSLPAMVLVAALVFLNADAQNQIPLALMGLAAVVLASIVAVGVFFDGSTHRGIPVATDRMDWETLICRLRFSSDAYRDQVRRHVATLPLSANLLNHISNS